MFVFAPNKIRKLHSDAPTELVIFLLFYGITRQELSNRILGNQVTTE